jgi:hypothetical protein
MGRSARCDAPDRVTVWRLAAWLLRRRQLMTASPSSVLVGKGAAARLGRLSSHINRQTAAVAAACTDHVGFKMVFFGDEYRVSERAVALARTHPRPIVPSRPSLAAHNQLDAATGGCL